MPAKILIIDDNFSAVDDQSPIEWISRVTLTGNIPTSVEGNSAEELFEAVENLLSDKSVKFDGVILDIIFKNHQPLGGITFWEMAKAANLLPRLGILMISTNSDYREELRDFAAVEADNRLYYDKLQHSLSMDHLKDFLELIPSAVWDLSDS